MMGYPEADSDRAQADALSSVQTSIETCLRLMKVPSFAPSKESYILQFVLVSVENIFRTTADRFWRLQLISHARGTIFVEIYWLQMKKNNLNESPGAYRPSQVYDGWCVPAGGSNGAG